MLNTPEKAADNLVYDVVIMGAGFAGNCQARHLLLNIPGIKIALIDPRPPERSEKDLKVGEATVEIASMFLTTSLKLHQYLIENHFPKYGLTFHWAKDPAKTTNVEDYHNIWVNGLPAIEAFHLNRATFEQDVLKMNQDMGATFYNGRVTQFDLASDNSLHTITVKLNEGYTTLKSSHLVDAAGRRFLIGKKTDNLISNNEKLLNINTGAAWLRVKNFKPNLYDGVEDPSFGNVNRHYTTHHWMGHGHWVWTIPISNAPNELSIGIAHHKDAIASKDINTLSKFKDFLKANHTFLFKFVESGEIVDFHYLPKVAHMSKQLVSKNNWYVLGDAAYMFDPFYSSGHSITAIAVESVTEVIRAKLAKEADADKKQELYNQFLVQHEKMYRQFYQKHEAHLGHASIMSWRIYLENMLWFGMLVPMFAGKWFLDPQFLKSSEKLSEYLVWGKDYNLCQDIYDQFDELIKRDINIGFMDYTRADQLAFGYGPHKSIFTGDWTHNCKVEPLRLNIFNSMKQALFYLAIFYFKLRLKGFGLKGVFNLQTLWQVSRILSWAIYCAMGEQIYLVKTRNLASNSIIEKNRKEFTTYHYQPQLQPWISQDSSKTA